MSVAGCVSQSWNNVKSWNLQAKMLAALRQGDESQLVALLDYGLDCDVTFRLNGSYRPAICLAVERGYNGLVEQLCARRCSTSQLDQGGLTPLQLAASFGFTGIMKCLLDNRADPNTLSPVTGDSALHLATSGDHKAAVQLLLDSGADVNCRNSVGRTSLMLAAGKGLVDMTRLLMDNGADHLIKDDLGNTALLLHCASPRLSPVLTSLLGDRLDLINQSNRNGDWPVVEIVRSDCQTRSQCLLETVRRGADISITTKLGSTPLHLAISRQDWTLAMILVRETRTGMLDLRDMLGNTPLDMALALDNTRLVDMLVSAGSTGVIRSSVDKLQWLARCKIRSEVGGNVSMWHSVQQMEIPVNLKQFLYYLIE